MNPNERRSVLIVQEHLPHYRAPFFECLRDELHRNQVDLRVTFSQKKSQDHLPGNMPWAEAVPIHWVGPLGWQNLLPRARGVSLVVAPQEVKYAAVPLLLFLRKRGGWKFAFWGHGRNFQARRPNSLSERWKRSLSRRADWWFAYNGLSARVVQELGFPRERITEVGNAIDTRSLIDLRAKVTEADQQALRRDLGISGENVAIFTGRLYPHKRIPFLLEACRQVRQNLPDFELIVLGSGPEEALVQEAARQYPWIHFVGPKDDREKIPYWSLAKVALMPGLLGLGVLDAFALGVPMVTTDYPYHSPEIGYISHGKNGWVARPWQDSQAFAQEVASLLKNSSLRENLAREALAQAKTLTIEAMSKNFCGGVLRCLLVKK